MPESRIISRDELIAAEARLIATFLIEVELNKDNLPLPKEAALEQHIDALLAGRPDLLEIARKRVDAKTDSFRDSLRRIGIETEVIEAVDL